MLTAFQEVSDALITRQKLAEVYGYDSQAVVALAESVELATQRYLNGKSSYYEVLQVQLELYPTQRAGFKPRLANCLPSFNSTRPWAAAGKRCNLKPDPPINVMKTNSCRLNGWLFTILAIVISGYLTGEVQAAHLKPVYLRTEYCVDPLGVDVTQPRLSWQLESNQRGSKQTAFQILVASSPKLLQQGNGDLWDSGRVASDETIGTAYAGSLLISQEHCYWKVCVWDADGHSTWSSPAEWSMGLLKPEDWKAGWVGYDEERTASVARQIFTQ